MVKSEGKPRLIVRNATTEDAAGIVELEKRAYPTMDSYPESVVVAQIVFTLKFC